MRLELEGVSECALEHVRGVTGVPHGVFLGCQHCVRDVFDGCDVLRSTGGGRRGEERTEIQTIL